MAERERESVRSTGRAIATLKLWAREPLLHFLLIGLALFAGYRALNPEAGKQPDNNRIVITDDDVRQLQISWMAQWRRPPTQDELGGLLRSKVREEVLFREAMTLGLDKNDTIIKRRLAQKMEFLADDVSALAEPTTEQLKAFFERNPARFATPGLVSFRHLYFSTDQRGEKTQDAAAALLVKLAAAGPPEDAADAFMYKDSYVEQSAEQVAAIFGGKFAQSLFQLKPGVWQGPVESGLGWHLVFVEAIEAGRVPAFQEVDAAVKAEWIEGQRAGIKQKLFEEMSARYEIVLPQDSAKQAAR
jgi:hypothetical protein